MEWVPETEYKVGDVVKCLNKEWKCIVNHKSSVFAKDVIELNYWIRYENF